MMRGDRPRTVLRGFRRVQIGKLFKICDFRVPCGLPCPDSAVCQPARGVEAIAGTPTDRRAIVGDR